MHLFLELFTLGAFLATAWHALRTRGRDGLAAFAALLLLGFLRENAVAIRGLLYGFAPLHLMLGRAPLIATIIWGFSISSALAFAAETAGDPLARGRTPWRALAAVALFMMALAGFYEPFLDLVGMARWQAGTRTTLGVPWIALVGYPTLAVGFVLLWRAVRTRSLPASARAALLIGGLPALALGHAFGLQAVKRALGW